MVNNHDLEVPYGLKMDGCEMIPSFWGPGPIFKGELSVSGSVKQKFCPFWGGVPKMRGEDEEVPTPVGISHVMNWDFHTMLPTKKCCNK